MSQGNVEVGSDAAFAPSSDTPERSQEELQLPGLPVPAVTSL
jgi:hypothetical protein